MRLQGCQIRMARAALRLSLTELARLSGVSEKTIRRCEAVDGPPPIADASLSCISQALNEHGIRFTMGKGLSWGPGCTLDWNPDKGGRADVHARIETEGDPELGGPRFGWPPLPAPKVGPNR